MLDNTMSAGHAETATCYLTTHYADLLYMFVFAAAVIAVVGQNAYDLMCQNTYVAKYKSDQGTVDSCVWFTLSARSSQQIASLFSTSTVAEVVTLAVKAKSCG